MKIGKLYRCKLGTAHLKGMIKKGQVIMPILWDKNTTYDDMGQRTIWLVKFMIPGSEEVTRIKFPTERSWKDRFVLVDISK